MKLLILIELAELKELRTLRDAMRLAAQVTDLRELCELREEISQFGFSDNQSLPKIKQRLTRKPSKLALMFAGESKRI